MSSVGGNYMSDGAIMAWVTAQQDRLYGDLKTSMGEQEQQAQMQSDLADLKKNLEVATRHEEKLPAVAVEMQEFLDKYGGVPEFDELTGAVADIKTSVDAKITEAEIYRDALEIANAGGPVSMPDAFKAVSDFKSETVKGWMDLIDKKLDATGTNQQLGMIHLNEIRATIDQSTQMASQLVKSGNDALNTVLNNFV